MKLNISRRTALVTGAASGIGFETVRQLIGEGVTVVMTDRDNDDLATARERLAGPDDKVFAFAADLTSTGDLSRMHEYVREHVGLVDILVNSAGVTGAQGRFDEIDDAGWIDAIDVNLHAPVRLTREFLTDLRAGGWGRIVYLASEDATQPYEDELPYCAAKAGVLAFAKGLSRTYAHEGLLVNCVSPAFIHTPMTDAMMRGRAEKLGVEFDEAIESFLTEERPFMSLGRRGEPAEVASVILFLCSDAASFVNGSNYRVDSGSVGAL